jgi:hypothetical protein
MRNYTMSEVSPRKAAWELPFIPPNQTPAQRAEEQRLNFAARDLYVSLGLIRGTEDPNFERNYEARRLESLKRERAWLIKSGLIIPANQSEKM